MPVTVDGIISGIDTTSLINDILSAYSQPKTLLENKIADYDLLQSSLADLSGRLGDLSDALEDLKDVKNLRAFAVNYPETDALIADATGDAVAGVYNVAITALAESEMEVSEGFADTQSLGVIAEGTLSITYNGTTTDITVDGTNSSLSELAASIDDIEGISAYVMNTGDALNPYRLVIQGESTGEDYGIEIDTSGLIGAGAVPTFTEQSTAANAALTINGVAVSSASNEVNSAIPGLKLNLTNTTTSPVKVTVTLDGAAVQEKVQTFVDAYNDIIDYVSENSVAADDESGVTAGIFNGDSSVRWILNTLRSKITGTYTGNALNSLGLIGIKLDNTGKLEIDEGDFQSALTTRRDQLEAMFTSDDGFGATMISTLDVYTDPVDGTIKQRTDSIDSTVEGLEEQVARWTERITRYEERLRNSFANFEGIAGASQTTALFLESYFFSPEN